MINAKFVHILKLIIVQIMYPILGMFILTSSLPAWEIRENWDVLFIYTVLATIASFASIRVFNTVITLNNAVIFSGILLFDTWIGVWAAIIEAIVLGFLVKPQFFKFLANSGQLLISVWIVGTLKNYINTGVDLLIIKDFVLIFVYFISNLSLASFGVSYFIKRPWKEIVYNMVNGASFVYLLLMVFGEIGARLVLHYGLASVVPLVFTYFSLSNVSRRYLQGVNELQAKVEEVKKLNASFLTAMAASIDARDPYTHGHSHRVAFWGREIAKELGLSPQEVEQVYHGGILHDIGKIGIEDDILNKEGKLTAEEYEKIKEHPVIGYEIIKQAGVFEELLPAIRWHHERIDGMGYPDGLKGEEIPLMARILAVSDAFDAMVSNRPYRDGLPIEVALQMIEENMGSQFDEKIARAFLQLVNRYPREELDAIIKHTGKTHQEILQGAS